MTLIGRLASLSCCQSNRLLIALDLPQNLPWQQVWPHSMKSASGEPLGVLRVYTPLRRWQLFCPFNISETQHKGRRCLHLFLPRSQQLHLMFAGRWWVCRQIYMLMRAHHKLAHSQLGTLILCSSLLQWSELAMTRASTISSHFLSLWLSFLVSSFVQREQI